MINAVQFIIDVDDRASRKLGVAAANAGRSLEKVERAAKNMEKRMLGAGLSFLFTGMAIKRMADGALRSITDAYSQAIGEQGEFNKLTNQMAASWAFFKFSLMDALMQTGLFQILVTGVLWLLNVFNALPGPVKNFIVIFLVGMAAMGGAMMIFGQTVLGILGIMALFGVTSMSALGPILLTFLAIITIITLVASVWGTSWNPVIKILMSVLILMVGIAVIIALLGYTVSWPFLLLGAAIVAVIALFVLFAKHWREAFENIGFAVRWLAINIKSAFGDAINWVIDKLNTVIKWFNGISGMNFSTMGHVDFNVNDDIDSLTADIAAADARRAGGGQTTVVNNIEVNGAEAANTDADGLADTIMKKIEDKMGRSVGSPQR